MIYVKGTLSLKSKYQKAKHVRNKCIKDAKNEKERAQCWVDYYKQVVKLIYTNIKLLEKTGQLTPVRKKILINHFNKAYKHLKDWEQKSKEF